VIVCWRTVAVPPDQRGRYLSWVAEGRTVREAHGILAEWVLEPAGGDGNTVVVTVWPSHEAFDAWIATPERDALTASDVHRAVSYQPIVRYDLAGGYTNLPGLAALYDPPTAPAVPTEEDQP
jgi:heme-degrading monooxygenase HmoA